MRWAMRSGVLAVVLAFACAAEARVYEWIDPRTQTLQLSGSPPPWYRSEWGGPRVRVLENGVVIDDTAIEVSEAEAEVLRAEAFREFEARQQELEALRRLEQEARLEAAKKARAEAEAEAETEEGPAGEEGEALASETITEETIDQLKAIIREWDRRNIPRIGE